MYILCAKVKISRTYCGTSNDFLADFDAELLKKIVLLQLC